MYVLFTLWTTWPVARELCIKDLNCHIKGSAAAWKSHHGIMQVLQLPFNLGNTNVDDLVEEP